MMKKCNIYLIVLSLVIFSSINVFAEETNIYSYKVTVENGEATAVEEELFSEVDNSDLMVDVIREDQGVRTTIYSGVLSGYDNGQWIHLDFSTVQFCVIFNWESIENEAFYIIPQSSNEETIDNKSKRETDVDKETKPIEPQEQNKQQMERLDRNLLEENTQPITDDIEYEMNYTIGTINDESVISVSCNITNNSLITKNPVMIIAIYEDGKLLNLKTQAVEVTSGSTESGNIFLEIPEENRNRYAIKLMAWESMNSIRPLGDAKTVNDIDAYLREKYIYFDTTEGEEIKVFMNSTQTIGNNPNAVHTIIYNPEEFEPKDLCGLTYEKELMECEPENTNICIFDFEAENGIIKYKFNSEIGRNTGINNYIKFTALSTNDDCEIQHIIQ